VKSDPDTGVGPSIEKSAKVYRPIRNAIGHTSIITEQAKNALNVEFNNIKARLEKIVDSVKTEDKAPYIYFEELGISDMVIEDEGGKECSHSGSGRCSAGLHETLYR